MAQELSEFPAGTGRGRASVYPWDVWMNGKIWKLQAGEDIPATTKLTNFRQNAIDTARRREGKVRTAIVDDGKAIIVQFFKE